MNWMHMIYQGGWVMVPLGFCSVLALAIILERLISLRKDKIMPGEIVERISNVKTEKELEILMTLCRTKRSPLNVLIEEIIRHKHEPKDTLLEHIQVVGRTQVSLLERGLTLLQIIAVISPLLGLLGTVLGMVDIFNVITVGGIGNPQMLAQGISKALITTVAGLVIAIPSLVAYHLFLRRVEELAVALNELSVSFLSKVKSIV